MHGSGSAISRPNPWIQIRIRSKLDRIRNTNFHDILGVREKNPEISLTQGVRGKSLKEYSI